MSQMQLQLAIGYIKAYVERQRLLSMEEAANANPFPMFYYGKAAGYEVVLAMLNETYSDEAIKEAESPGENPAK
jgi:hypothetical protein